METMTIGKARIVSSEMEIVKQALNPHAASHHPIPAYNRILRGWFSRFHNGMTPILMRSEMGHLHELTDENRSKSLYFLDDLLRNYEYASNLVIPTIEFLIDITKRYPDITEEERRKGEDAVNQIFDGFEIPRPSQRAAAAAKVVGEEKARLGAEISPNANS